MSSVYRVASTPSVHRNSTALPQLPRHSAARSRRSISAAARRSSSVARGMVGSVASSVASAVSASVNAATFVSRLRRPKHAILLEPLEDRPTISLPHLSLEGPEDERPPLCLHNPGLIRWIFEEAREIHLNRPEYRARQNDARKEDRMHSVIFREVLLDVMTATRRCCAAYRVVECLSEAAGVKAKLRQRTSQRFQKVRTKLLVMSIFGKLLQEKREESEEAELMWKNCCNGLSLSLCSKMFASRSRGVGSMRGSISLSLRKYRRGATSKSLAGDAKALS